VSALEESSETNDAASKASWADGSSGECLECDLGTFHREGSIIDTNIASQWALKTMKCLRVTSHSARCPRKGTWFSTYYGWRWTKVGVCLLVLVNQRFILLWDTSLKCIQNQIVG
jgi:hypothetical protein